MFAGANAEVNLGHDKVNRLIYEFKGGSLINLMGRNGLGNLGTVKMGALDFGGQCKTLRVFAKKQNGGIYRQIIIKQVKMSKHFLDIRIRRNRKVTGFAGMTNKTNNGF